LKESLDELGPVNLEAVAELSEVEERHGFLDAQRTDLEDARKSLDETVRRLDEESERRFLEAFTEIREHFKTVFRQLFGGGRAEITLLEGAGALEAGIEITARPPGREVLPISLLSGGQRTLTALAILFAVFRSQPSPFCILDEVDAALDDANIGRFLSLLTATLDETQFVVVTHNKGTMAACSLLYGVTMAVRGVSHVVSVELSQVDEIIPARARAGSEPAAGTRALPSESDARASEQALAGAD
jgi:chromosome segregation protein